MYNPFQVGQKKILKFFVTAADTAAFESGQVHPVYATFALGRDAEWTCRQFVLEMKDVDEEGIGTFLTIYHHSPALRNAEVVITATLKSVNGHEIICTWEAHCGERLIASGETGQKILKKDKIDRLFSSLKI